MLTSYPGPPLVAGRAELVPQLHMRPTVIKFEGWREFIVIHDLWYLREKSRWRLKLNVALRRGSMRKRNYRQTVQGYKDWKMNERIFYSWRGMLPPDERPTHGPIHALRPMRRPRRRLAQ